MKKFMKKNLKLLILILVVLIVILLTIMFISVFNKPSNKPVKGNYKYSDDKKELPGIKEYSGDKLAEEHCIDNICVKNVKLYYDDKNKNGRVECNIVNKTGKKATGYLKLVFDDSIIIYYKDLEADTERGTTSQFSNKKITDKTDYKLKKLTDKEISKIK